MFNSVRRALPVLPKFSILALALSCAFGHAMADDAKPDVAAPLAFSDLAAKCAPKVNSQTLNALVGNESTYNPYAIGVVDGVLERQPRSKAEAVATADRLERDGYNFSVGIGQFNIKNIRAMGLTVEELFDPCRNLQVSSDLLVGYYTDALDTTPNKQEALRKALSRYYSGNERRGFQPDKPGDPSYVQKVVSRALSPNQTDPIVPALEATESDRAIPIARRTDSPAARPTRARKAATDAIEQWVIVTPTAGTDKPVVQPEVVPAERDDSESEGKQTIQVSLNTGDDAGTAVAEFHRPKPAVPPSKKPRAVDQQAAPSFVQIIN
jgi:type IV secretion system protein VirB1